MSVRLAGLAFSAISVVDLLPRPKVPCVHTSYRSPSRSTTPLYAADFLRSAQRSQLPKRCQLSGSHNKVSGEPLCRRMIGIPSLPFPAMRVHPRSMGSSHSLCPCFETIPRQWSNAPSFTGACAADQGWSASTAIPGPSDACPPHPISSISPTL